MTPEELSAYLAARQGLTLPEYREQQAQRVENVARHMEASGPDCHGNTAATFRRMARKIRAQS